MILHNTTLQCFDAGGVPERPMGADCKSAGLCLRRFESYLLHHLFPQLSGCSSMVEL